MKDRPWTGCVFRSTTQTSPSGVDSTRGTRSARCRGASRTQRSGGGLTWESAGAPVDVVTGGGALGGRARAACGVKGGGQVAGSAASADGGEHACLWSGGVMLDVGTLGGSTSLAFGVNDAGQVVGAAATAG